MKIKMNQNTVDKALSVYVCLFITYTLGTRIIPVATFLEGPVNSIMFILFALCGSILVLIDFLTTKYMFQPKYTWCLIVFILVMGVSSFIHMDYGYFDNLKTMVWSIIHFMLFYSLSKRGDAKQQEIFIRVLIFTILIIFGIAVLISLGQYILKIEYTTLYNGRNYRQGFMESRLFGIFIDPNYAAATSLMALLGSIYLLFKQKTKCMRFALTGSSIIHMAYIVLSGSRSVFIAYVVTMVVFVFLIVRRYTLIHSHRDDRTIYSILAFLLALCLSVSSYMMVRKICLFIPNVLSVSSAGDLLEREDISEGDISNNRLAIWQGYIEATIESDHLLFGLSPRNAIKYIQDQQPDNYIALTSYETHNAYISVFAFTGVMGSIVIGIFMFLSIRKAWQHVFVMKDYTIEYMICLSIVGGLATYSFFITDLFFMNNISTLMFWTLLGYVNSYQGRWELWQN